MVHGGKILTIRTSWKSWSEGNEDLQHFYPHHIGIPTVFESGGIPDPEIGRVGSHGGIQANNVSEVLRVSIKFQKQGQ